ADRIRRAAGVIAAKLERWQSLVLQVFDEVQPLVLDVERATTHHQEAEGARYALLRGLYELRAVAGQRIAAEQLETAYIDLYGYDPRSPDCSLVAVRQLQELDERAFGELCTLAGRDLTARTDPASGQSGTGISDELRRQCTEVAQAYEHATGPIITEFQT